MNSGRILLAALAAAGLAAAAPAQAQRQVNERESTGPTGTVEITMGSGTVRVLGWSRGEVSVTGTLSRSNDRVQIDAGRSGVEIDVVGARGRAGPATLEVRVPAGKRVEVQTSGGTIHVSGITGDVEAMNQGGPITIEGNARDVELMTQGGPINVNGTLRTLSVHSMSGSVTVGGTVRGRLEIDAMSGSVSITAAAGEMEVSSLSGAVSVTNVAGPVDINSVSGPVRLAGRRLSGSVSSVSADIVVDGSLGGSLSVESHNGSVEMRLPAGTDADVDVTSFSGGFRSDFGQGRRDGGERHLRLGSGGHALSISTFSGSVRLTRR